MKLENIHITKKRYRDLLNDFDNEAGRPRRRGQYGFALLYLATYLGSPVSEVSQVIGENHAVLADMAKTRRNRLDATTLERLGDWVQALFWRHTWRTGEREARRSEAIEEARRHTFSLCIVPDDWLRDYLVAREEYTG